MNLLVSILRFHVFYLFVEGQDLGEESVMEQLKCILANLVFKGHVKGYIAHEKNFLVLSANNPFPRIAKS